MKILLHICCASCAVYPVRILQNEKCKFAGFWFNPNIHPYQEYELRLDSLRTLENRLNMDMIYTDEYNPAEYFKGLGTEIPITDVAEDFSESIALQNVPATPDNSNRYFDVILRHSDGRENTSYPLRCEHCYRLRLEKTAEAAKRHDFDAFTTTLLISPYQNFEQIADIGRELSEKYNVFFYLKDFRQYFREAMAYSREAGLYRQKYCGCIYSREERKQKVAK